MSLTLIDVNDFVELGEQMNPYITDAIKTYESHWLGSNSPYNKEGDIHLYTNTEKSMRICLLFNKSNNTSDFQNLFCFYARKKDVSNETKTNFFNSLESLCLAKKVKTLLGPLQFSTWHSYRFISDRGDSPYFAGEQKIPEEWSHDFTEFNFVQEANYESILVKDIAASIVIGDKMGIKEVLPNLTIAKYEGDSFKAIAKELFSLSLEVFKGNYGYSPITFEEFAGLLLDHTPDKTFLVTAMVQNKIMGFAYSYSIGNWNNNSKPTSVLKTLGVHHDFRNKKVGYGLSYLTHQFWEEQNYGQIIHAYMKTDNASKSMSNHFGASIRNYSLYKRTFAS